MVTEKEFQIIRALVEDEMESISSVGLFSSKVVSDYFLTLSNISEKIKRDIEEQRDFSEEIAFQ